VAGMYLLGKKMTGTRRFGVMAAAIYIIDPANLLYINMPTGEHIFALLFPIAMLVFLALFEQRECKNVMRFGMALLLGILIGLMDIYRPFAPIFLIAIVITLALSEWLPKPPAAGKEKRRKRILMHALLIAIVLIGYVSTKQLCFSAIGYYAQTPPNRHGVGWTLRVGLNQESGGLVTSALIYSMSIRYRDSGEDYRTVSAQLAEEALAQIEGKQFIEIFRFVRNKFDFTWQSNQDFYNWATNTQIESGLNAYDSERLRLLGDPLNDAFLVFSLVLSALGALYSAIKRADKGTLMIGLFILGFSLLLLVVEIQQRYRSVLVSAIPFFTAYGLYAISDGITAAMATIQSKLRPK